MTPRPDDHVRPLLGAFVLGHLGSDEAAAVRAHLDGCPPCREEAAELGAVAELLPIVDPDRLGTPAEAPPALLDEVLVRIQQERETHHRARRRTILRRVSAVAAAVVLAVAVGVIAVRTSSGPGGEIVAMTATVPGVKGEAVVHSDPDATWVELRTSGLSAGQTYAVWLEEEGTKERSPLGTFIAVEGKLYISLYSPLLRDRAAAIGVSSPDGSTVMQGAIPDPVTHS